MIIECNLHNCIYNNEQHCQADSVVLTDENVLVYTKEKLTKIPSVRCGTYEKRTDYVEFFEARGFE